MIKLIIFDYDGVIVDSFSNVYDIYKIIGSELNVKIPSTIEEFRNVYGYDFHECYKNLGMDVNKQKKAVEIFKREIITKKPDLFQGIKDVLKWAYNNYKLVLVSSNYNDEVVQKLTSHNIDKYFSGIIGHKYGQCELDKSKEFKSMLDKYNVNSNEAIVIGDRLCDYDSGILAGINNIILVEYGWGYDKNKFENNNKLIISKPMQLIDAIKAIDIL
ncbi:HAD family hydrolase [Clostridium sp. WILCCON 0269]|uniref:HAD family hydrolase n=1 Tax=Candidatus Clostridium eludens TaxID=3381663 RepID=A0ABW8SHJ9_9CLOT